MASEDIEANMACPCCSANGTNPSKTNASNIWQTMVKTVRDVDMQRVTNTKEDIDTLLVFAGLFSAVVTGFVVTTYPNLQPDDSDEIVFLLRQSLAQNYTVSDGVLRPMAPFPSDPPFEAPLWAIRVNGLWFASLIVSLSTASFGMLVKQWLIEYLAMEWISPQERLRARQYRYPGLKDWKVFEIAAVLPLLLHISLGLFFLGLCFYTAAANETVGRSTFPLVAGWAFFALLTVVAPLASPRCPYKVTLLKAAMRVGRRYVTSRLRRPILVAKNTVVSVAKRIWNVICLPFRLVDTFISGFWELVKVGKKISALLGILVFLFYAPFGLLKLLYTYLMKFAVSVVAVPENDNEEEEDIMKKPHETHELLLSVDKVIINDGPILETMLEVLKQTHTDSPFITTFVLGCIRHRIGAANGSSSIPNIEGPVQGLLDLRTLSESAWNLLTGLMGETLGPHLSLTEKAGPVDVNLSSYDPWMANAAAVLVSKSRRTLPKRVVPILSNPITLAKVLQLVRTVNKAWPLRDILSLLWIAFASQKRDHSNMSAEVIKNWDSLPALDDRAPSDLQEAVTQILLENAWRIDDEDSERCTAEAIIMLIFLLNAAPPLIDSNSNELQISLGPSYYQGRLISNVEDAMKLRDAEHPKISSRLLAVAGKSPDLILNALNLYTVFVTRSLVGSHGIPLWKILHNMKNDEGQSSSLRPVLLDLWKFLLESARPVGDTASRLQTHDFIKLCLVLAQPGVPRIFGRERPADDWGKLIPILEKIAGDDTPIENFSFATMAAREETIPGLANHAFDELKPDDPDVPERLREVLARFAGRGPKPPPKKDGGSRVTMNFRLPFIPRRGGPGDASGGTERPTSLNLEAGQGFRHSIAALPAPRPPSMSIWTKPQPHSVPIQPSSRTSFGISDDVPLMPVTRPVAIPPIAPLASAPLSEAAPSVPPTPVMHSTAPLASAPSPPDIHSLSKARRQGVRQDNEPYTIVSPPSKMPSPPSSVDHTAPPRPQSLSRRSGSGKPTVATTPALPRSASVDAARIPVADSHAGSTTRARPPPQLARNIIDNVTPRSLPRSSAAIPTGRHMPAGIDNIRGSGERSRSGSAKVGEGTGNISHRIPSRRSRSTSRVPSALPPASGLQP